MKLIIDIPKIWYDSIMNERSDVLNAEFIKNGIPLPEDVSNGDMIQAVFPNGDLHDSYEHHVIYEVNYADCRYNKDWWNAPYGRCDKNLNEHLHTYKFTYIHGLDNSYHKVEFQAKNEKEAEAIFYKRVGENFEHRILYIKQDNDLIYEF